MTLTKKKPLFLALLASASIILAGCDEFEALPTPETYDAPILNLVDDGLYQNRLGEIYDALVSSGDTNSERVLKNVLYIYATSVYGNFFDTAAADGTVVKGLRSTVESGDEAAIKAFAETYPAYKDKEGKGDAGKVIAFYQDVLYRIRTVFLGYVNDSTYQDRSRFVEKKFYDAQVASYYDLAQEENGIAPYNEGYTQILGTYVLTDAIVISVSERRSVVNVYVHGKSYQIQPVSEIMASVNQLVSTLQTTRTQLDRALLRLTALELDDYVTLADITDIFSSFEILQQAKNELKFCIVKLGSQGKLVRMQLEQLAGDVIDNDYNLMIRDYAQDSSEENAVRIRKLFSSMSAQELTNPKRVAEALGYDDLDEDSVMTPLGLRTLSQVSVVRDGVAEKIVDEYGSLQELLDDIQKDPERLGDFGVNNPTILADSLYRIKGKRS